MKIFSCFLGEVSLSSVLHVGLDLPQFTFRYGVRGENSPPRPHRAPSVPTWLRPSTAPICLVSSRETAEASEKHLRGLLLLFSNLSLLLMCCHLRKRPEGKSSFGLATPLLRVSFRNSWFLCPQILCFCQDPEGRHVLWVGAARVSPTLEGALTLQSRISSSSLCPCCRWAPQLRWPFWCCWTEVLVTCELFRVPCNKRYTFHCNCDKVMKENEPTRGTCIKRQYWESLV